LRHRGRQKRPSRSERARRPAQDVKRAERRIAITLPSRRVPPERVVAHLGPTNSGKTHEALEELAVAGTGVYAGPLRMLAQEAHRRLGARLGEERVGLVTGEERVNERAPLICCTVEMAPSAGELLVLDEVQWADDEERGSAWTRLLLAGEYREILLLGALDALPLVEHAFPEAELKVFERKLPLEWVGERTLRSLGTGTVVVAFSRRAVLALAGEVNRTHPGRVAVLYGAMPLSSRREEIDRFLSGASDVCVATDVLGHGVNLPCETLLFAETTKFDGEERRDLLPWELAQIAGRAFVFHCEKPALPHIRPAVAAAGLGRAFFETECVADSVLRGRRGMSNQRAQVVEVLLIKSALGELAALPLGDELLRSHAAIP